MSADTPIPTIMAGVPFEKDGTLFRVLDVQGEWMVRFEQMPRWQSDSSWLQEQMSAEKFTARFGLRAAVRHRTVGDGLGPLCQGDRIEYPYKYAAVPADKRDPQRYPGVPERVIPCDAVILCRWDMRYRVSIGHKLHDSSNGGTRPFLVGACYGLCTRGSFELEQLTSLGYEVDWNLLGAPIPWANPGSPGVFYNLISDPVTPAVNDETTAEEAILARRRAKKATPNV